MFKIDEIEQFYFDAVSEKYGNVKRFDVNKELISLRKSTRSLAKHHLFEWVVLIDEGLQFLIHLELLISKNENKGILLFNIEGIVAKLKSLVISFRELILIGQSDSARIILRALIDTSDLAISTLYDKDFCYKYGPDSDEHDDNTFWKKRIAYGKIYHVIEDALINSDFTKEESEQIIKWKKSIKNDQSGSVHAASWSTTQSLIIPSLNRPGFFYTKALGHLSAYSPPLCHIVIQELVILARTFTGLLNNNIPSHLKGFSTGSEYASTIASSETLIEFYDSFRDSLQIPLEDLIPDMSPEKI